MRATTEEPYVIKVMFIWISVYDGIIIICGTEISLILFINWIMNLAINEYKFKVMRSCKHFGIIILERMTMSLLGNVLYPRK